MPGDTDERLLGSPRQRSKMDCHEAFMQVLSAHVAVRDKDEAERPWPVMNVTNNKSSCARAVRHSFSK